MPVNRLDVAEKRVGARRIQGRLVTLRRGSAALRQRGYDARALIGGITAWHAIGGKTVPLDTSTYEKAP